VIRARQVQASRFSEEEGVYANAQMGSRLLRKTCVLDKASGNLLKVAMEKLSLSARAYDRILKVSRTIADLAGKASIQPEHIAEAIQYRGLDRESWGR
jgi:magnesium chelatase family protein